MLQRLTIMKAVEFTLDCSTPVTGLRIDPRSAKPWLFI